MIITGFPRQAERGNPEPTVGTPYSPWEPYGSREGQRDGPRESVAGWDRGNPVLSCEPGAAPGPGRATGGDHTRATGYGPRMLLSDRDLKLEIDKGNVGLDPYDPGLVQPASIDVRLDRHFRVFENHRYPHIDPAEEQPELTRPVQVEPDEPFILHPGEFVLGSTLELVSLPHDIASRLEGKSSLGRLGLLTHSTAGWIDPGFTGHVTLELSNVATLPIKLWPGMKIGQMCFFRLSSPAAQPYGSARSGSRYQGQRGPTPSRSYLNFHADPGSS